MSGGSSKPTPIPVNIDGLEWGFHYHPFYDGSQDAITSPGKWAVAQVWLTDWSWRKTEILTCLKAISDSGKKVIVRVEDPSLYSQADKWGLIPTNLSTTWYDNVYGNFLNDVIVSVKLAGVNLYGIQPYNEPFLNSLYMRGSNGDKITPAELVLFHSWVRGTLNVINANVKLVSAAATNFHEQEYRDKWRQTLSLGLDFDDFNLHIYTDDPSSKSSAYCELSSILSGKSVIVGEIGCLNSNASPDTRIKVIPQIASMLHITGLNIKGICIYSWQEPKDSPTPGWTSRNTKVEAFVESVK